MGSDQERRDIAEGLRGLKGECVPLAYVLDELGMDCDGADVPKAHVYRLADLVDRQTCRNVADPADGGLFECSNCGETWELTCGGIEENHLFFCPNCGGEVVE